MSVQLKFYGTEETKTNQTSLEVFLNTKCEITVSIEDESVDHDYNVQFLSLDKQTAIRLVRELRKLISEI